MTWDDDDQGHPSIEELLAQQEANRGRWHVPALTAVTVVSLLVAAGLIASGRSLIGHALGFVLAAIATPGAASVAGRLASTRRSLRIAEERVLRRLIVINGAAVVVAVLHAAYLARRYV